MMQKTVSCVMEKMTMIRTEDNCEQWIAQADYEELLRANRFAPPGDPMFKLKYAFQFIKRFRSTRAELTTGQAVAVSKKIGWSRKHGRETTSVEGCNNWNLWKKPDGV